MGRPCTPLGVALLLVCACDLQSSKRLKLPEQPKLPDVEQRADPTAWSQRGDAACPSLDVPTTTGAPGTTVQAGRLTKHPQTGALACQAAGFNHGPATDVGPRGETMTGIYRRGVRRGTWEGRFGDGGIKWRGDYSGGIEAGQWSYWDRDGKPLATGDVNGRQRRGMWLFWDRPVADSGDASRFEVYDRGRVVRRGLIEEGKPVITHPVCALGTSAPYCRVILAGGLTYRFGSRERTDGGDRHSMSVDASTTINLLRRHGITASGSLYAGDEYARYGLRAGYRFYIHPVMALDATVGFLYPRGGLAPNAADTGRHARLELGFGDQVAIGGEISQFDADGGDSEWAAFATIRVGLIPLAMIAYIAASIGGR